MCWVRMRSHPPPMYLRKERSGTDVTGLLSACTIRSRARTPLELLLVVWGDATLLAIPPIVRAKSQRHGIPGNAVLIGVSLRSDSAFRLCPHTCSPLQQPLRHGPHHPRVEGTTRLLLPPRPVQRPPPTPPPPTGRHRQQPGLHPPAPRPPQLLPTTRRARLPVTFGRCSWCVLVHVHVCACLCSWCVCMCVCVCV